MYFINNEKHRLWANPVYQLQLPSDFVTFIAHFYEKLQKQKNKVVYKKSKGFCMKQHSQSDVFYEQ
jgi:hypothetical protein